MSATIFSSSIMETDNNTKEGSSIKDSDVSINKELASTGSQTFTPQKTKIPVPSPTPLRRSYSLRVKGDRKSQNYDEKYNYFDYLDDSSQDVCDNANIKPSSKPYHHHPPPQQLAPSTLHRGRSFNYTNAEGHSATFRSGTNHATVTSGPNHPARRTTDYMQWRAAGSLTNDNKNKSHTEIAVKTGTTHRTNDNSFARTKLMSRSMTLPQNHPSTSKSPTATSTSPRIPPPSTLPHHLSPRSPGSVSAPRTPCFHHNYNISHGDVSRRRAGSCSLNVTTAAECDSWETDSLASGVSGLSLASTRGGGECDHASVARNGTTFSGRSMKYVFHCNQHAGQTGEDYLTPTQRAHRQVRKLKALLREAQSNLEQKDSDIVKLTKEVVELRLYKAALGSPEDKSNSSDVDVVTVRENDDADGYEGIANAVSALLVNGEVGETSLHNAKYNEMNNSYTDSGHYDDYTCSSVNSKDSVLLGDEYSQSPVKQRKHHLELVDRATSVDNKYTPLTDLEVAHKELVAEYERRLLEMSRSHDDEQQDLKTKHTDKVEELLQRITEINTRYWELVPELDSAKERITELEHQLDEAMKKLEEQEEKHKQTFLQMYNQGQEAARMQQENQLMELSQRSPNRISVSELLHQLQVTQTELENLKDVEYTSKQKQPLLSAKEAVSLWVLGARKAMYRQLTEAKASRNKIDPEITLQFLKSAIYYFLTDKENNQGHLKAIQSILGFTQTEISNIEKARLT